MQLTLSGVSMLGGVQLTSNGAATRQGNKRVLRIRAVPYLGALPERADPQQLATGIARISRDAHRTSPNMNARYPRHPRRSSPALQVSDPPLLLRLPLRHTASAQPFA